jgi:exonuclease SbcD
MLVPPPCPIIYAGSIDRVDFMEENDPKGYCLAQITRGRSTAEFVPLAARRFLTITAELGDENPTQDVLRAIERRADAIPDAIVRLQLRGARIQHEQVDERAIRTALREAHNIAGLARDYTDATTARLTQTSVQGRTPLELLELYFDRRGILPDRRAELLPLAQELLSRTQPV